jgi:hypothetical protein
MPPPPTNPTSINFDEPPKTELEPGEIAPMPTKVVTEPPPSGLDAQAKPAAAPATTSVPITVTATSSNAPAQPASTPLAATNAAPQAAVQDLDI